MHTRTFWLAALAVVLAPVAALAQAQAVRNLPDGGEARVAVVVDGDTLVLDDGRQVRLVGIQAPKLALGRAGIPEWPLASESKAYLEQLALRRRVHLYLPTTAIDRHGRLLVHLLADDGRWLQGEMLTAGMARVYTFDDNRLLASEMLSRESDARRRWVGMWGLAVYRLRRPEEVARDINSFQVIEGRVVDAQTVRSWTYLNFGYNWRTDFTARLDQKALRLFQGAGQDPLLLKGQTVRLRGWVHERNGPMVDITHPEQVETAVR